MVVKRRGDERRRGLWRSRSGSGNGEITVNLGSRNKQASEPPRALYNIVYVPVPRVAGVYYCDKCLVHSSLELREAPIKSYKIIGMNTCEC